MMKRKKTAKRLLITICGILNALIVVELVVKFVIGYPVISGRERHVFLPKIGRFRTLVLYEPFSEFWTVEGGNRAWRRNNIGLPGGDFDLKGERQNILLAGSSFIEAYHMSNDQTAAAEFQRQLDRQYPKEYNVINIGSAKHDPYLAWFRTRFFAGIYPPAKVVLPVEGMFHEWFTQYKTPLDFTIPERFGERVEASIFIRFTETIRRYSSMMNMLARSLKMASRENVTCTETVTSDRLLLPEAMKQVLLSFREDYGNDFLLVSFNNDVEENRALGFFCEQNEINFRSTEDILQPQYRFDGDGHLNIEGNRMLGEFLCRAFRETYKEPTQGTDSR